MAPFARLDDALNPLLVRELRQSLRSKGFVRSFVFVLMGALALSATVLLADGRRNLEFADEAGEALFLTMHGCMITALLVIVPIGAFLSSAQEWNGGTWDQLALTNLRPRRIVLGRMLASGIQGVLFTSVLVPFLSLTLLLKGIDPGVVLFCTAWVVLWSPALAAIGLFLGASARPQQARALLLGLFAIGLVFVAWMVLMVSAEGIPDLLGHARRTQVAIVASGLAATAVVLGGYALVGACALITHPAENRSTPLRVLTAGVMLVGLGAFIWMYAEWPNTGGLYMFLTGGIFACAIPATFFASERERLSRREAGQVPRSRVLALLATPFLPGGGRGVLFTVLVLGTYVLAGSLAIHVLPEPARRLPEIGYGVFAAATLSVFVFVLGPTGVFALTGVSQRRRWISLLSVPSLVLAGIFAAQFGLQGPHVHRSPLILTNPFALPAIYWTATWVERDVFLRLHMVVLGWAAALTFLLNGVRVVRGVAEVQRASARRRGRRAA